MVDNRILNSNQKALEINLNDRIYGTFAEIGAGQEVARHFFRAGGAAGTIAKSMSAYDMTVSDAIYGKSARYVSKDRLSVMLEKELEQLVERLQEQRGEDTCFFVFADTVAARSFKTKKDGHGWLGVKFQHKPMAEASEVKIHVCLSDKDNLQQQEALGTIGVNLIYACYNWADDREKFISSLFDNLSNERAEVNMIELTGPAFRGVDSRLWSLELVKRNYCRAILFDSDGDVLLATDELYRKNIAICRASYRPPTLVNIDMLTEGTNEFRKTLDKEQSDNILILPEISMNKLRERGEVNNEDFLARVDLLSALGYHVLISNYSHYSELNYYLSQCTKMRIGFIFGFFNLEEIFDEKRYEKNAGGLFGGIGGLLGHRTNLFCYPAKDEKEKKILTTTDTKIHEDVVPFISYLQSRGYLHDIKSFNKKVFHIWSRVVLRMIQEGEEGWEKMVPESVANDVKKNCLFGYPCEV